LAGDDERKERSINYSAFSIQDSNVLENNRRRKKEEKRE